MIDPTKIRLALPANPIDQIIGVFSGSVSLSAPASVPGYTTGSATHAHNFGDSCYFQGIFSTDGGTTWNDFGAQTPNYAAPAPQLQRVDVEAYSDSANLYVQLVNWYDLNHSAGTAYTVQYKVYALAKNTMAAPIAPLQTNQKLAYSSAVNFQKIVLKGTTSISVAAGVSGSSATITHNLGSIPKIRAFFIDGSSRVFALNQWQPLISGGIPQSVVAVEAHITSTTLTFTSDQSGFGNGVSGNIDYRIYLDS